jgi:hypothetical protein
MGNTESKIETLIEPNDLIVDFFKNPTIPRWNNIRLKDNIYKKQFGKTSYKLFLYVAYTKHFIKTNNVSKPYTDYVPLAIKVDNLLYQKTKFKLKDIYILLLLYWATGNKDYIIKIKILSKDYHQTFVVQNSAFYIYNSYLEKEGLPVEVIQLENP